MSPWIEVSREDQGPGANAMVTLMRNAIAFNAHFMRSSPKLQDARFVTLLVDDEARRVGFRFSSEASENSLRLTPSSRKGKSAGRVVQCQALMSRFAWLRSAALVKSPHPRRFRPVWDSVDRLHYISLRPSFEVRAKAPNEILASVAGIYRYCRGDHIVYIGQGNIRARATQEDRAGWIFDCIEYSAVIDEPDRLHWENYWLEEHRRTHGCLPEYNRVGGKKP